MLKILKVKRGYAKKLNIQPTDKIISFDNFPAEDVLDFIFYDSKDKFNLKILKPSGEEQEFFIDKGEKSLNIVVENDDKILTCHNNCVFCFVDQMPKGLRESLYIKDDDYKMSFACGNFVTLTNVNDAELNKIIRLKLSPLYISVHTMNRDLRCKLMNNRFAGKIVDQIDALCKNGIKICAQAVIVPNMNDGLELEYTARELFKYYPSVKNLAIVPTGITKFREGLCKIPDIDKTYSQNIIKIADRLNAEFKTSFVLPADEYFVRAELPLKNEEFYGDFEQIENGVGMTTKFLSEFNSALENCELKKPKKSLIITGVSAKNIIDDCCKTACKYIKNLSAKAFAVENEFFGKTVTCTGLLTGIDILNALQNTSESFDEVVLAHNTLKEFDDVFLDGMSLNDFEKGLKGKKVTVNRGGGEELFNILSRDI